MTTEFSSMSKAPPAVSVWFLLKVLLAMSSVLRNVRIAPPPPRSERFSTKLLPLIDMPPPPSQVAA